FLIYQSSMNGRKITQAKVSRKVNGIVFEIVSKSMVGYEFQVLKKKEIQQTIENQKKRKYPTTNFYKLKAITIWFDSGNPNQNGYP
ncbi:MAG TPA: hypothetical protein PKY12_10900, partial [Catalimonadaceae bacterium]|nr:hypothetical protein [Catalimonadaceae bacterium]